MAARRDYAERRARAQGIGESKVFGGNVTRDTSGELPDGLEWDKLHVAGLPITSLPEDSQRRLAFMQTDEGSAWWEKNRHRLENRENSGDHGMGRGMNLPTGREATDPDEKKILEYRDRAGMVDSSDDNLDPMAQLLKQHVPSGFSGLLMGPRAVSTLGMTRNGVRYERLLDKDGKPIMLGDMFVAIAPSAEVERSKKRSVELSRSKRNEAINKLRESQDRAMSASSLERLARKKGLAADLAGAEEDEPTEGEFAGMATGGFGREFDE